MKKIELQTYDENQIDYEKRTKTDQEYINGTFGYLAARIIK